jgi:hypothetical protein
VAHCFVFCFICSQVEPNGTYVETSDVDKSTKGNRWKSSFYTSRAPLYLMRWIREGQQQQGTPQGRLRAQQQQERRQQRQQQQQEQQQEQQQRAVSAAGMAMVPTLHTILMTVVTTLMLVFW